MTEAADVLYNKSDAFSCVKPMTTEVPLEDHWYLHADSKSPSGYIIMALGLLQPPPLTVALAEKGHYEIRIGLYSPDYRCSGIFARLVNRTEYIFLRPAAELADQPYQEVSLGVHHLDGSVLEIANPYEYRSYVTHLRLRPSPSHAQPPAASASSTSASSASASASAASTDSGSSAKLVLGLADVWHYFYFFGSYDKDCIRNLVYQHKHCGFTHLVYELGRSCMNYETKVGDPKHFDFFRPRTRFVVYQTRHHTPLQTAVAACREHGLAIWGRLCLNIHYKNTYRGSATSRFAREHPEFWEIEAGGKVSNRQLCFGYPEVRAERVAILREALEFGVEGLLLDTMRYMPMAQWGRPYVEGFLEKYGYYPQESDEKWYRFRAWGFTMLLEEIKNMLAETGRLGSRGAGTPVALRLPAVTPEELLVQGVDLDEILKLQLISHLIIGEAKESIPADLVKFYGDLVKEHDIKLLLCYFVHGEPLPGPEHHRAGEWPAVTYKTPDVTPMIGDLMREYTRGTIDGVAFYETDEGAMFNSLRQFFRACRSLEDLGAFRP